MPGIDPIIRKATLENRIDGSRKYEATAAAHVTSAPWNRSVPTTRRADSGNNVTSAIPKKAPAPTDVRPKTNPKTMPMTSAR